MKLAKFNSNDGNILESKFYRVSRGRNPILFLVSTLIVVNLILFAGCTPAAAPSTPSNIHSPALKSASVGVKAGFADVTEKAGIDFLAVNGKTDKKYLLETMGSGCAFLDYDNDGFQDILLLSGETLQGTKDLSKSSLKLYRNNRNGTFSDVTQKAGLNLSMYAMGCAVGDYDNDGYQDFYVTCALGPCKLFHNNRNGTFSEVGKKSGVAGSGLWGTSCAWADVDGDGLLDLIVCNYVYYKTLKDDIPCFEAAGQRTYCIPGAFKTSHCQLYHNNGKSGFTDITEKSGFNAEGKSLGISVWDYDNDGLPDIFIANDTTPGFLFHNLGKNRFEQIGIQSGIAVDEQGAPHSGMGIDVNDIHNDGKCSVVFTNYSGQQTSFYNQVGSGVWHDDNNVTGIGPRTANTLGFGACFTDYDNDGLKDIVIVNGHVQDTITNSQKNIQYAEDPLLFRNEGGGKFNEIGQDSGGPFKVPIVGRSVAWGDFDNDGKMDLLVTANGGKAALWHNETKTKCHWLTFKLKGMQSNRDGIGAMITVKADGKTYRNSVRSGSSYLCASDLRAHFGLGLSKIAQVEVKWPSGKTDLIESAEADHIWELTEGSGKLK